MALFNDVRPEERRGVIGAFVVLFALLAGHTVLEIGARRAVPLPPARRAPARGSTGHGGGRGRAVARSGQGLRRFPGGGGLSDADAVLLRRHVRVLGIRPLEQPAGPGRALRLERARGHASRPSSSGWRSARYTITQAKRLYKLIGAGSVLGAVAGAGVARVVSERFGGGPLVLAAAVLFAITSAAAFFMLSGKTRAESDSVAPADPVSIRQWTALLRAHPYVPRLAGLVLVSTVALTLGDYVFKSQVAQNIDRAHLPAFFANVYMVLNVLALITQFALTGRAAARGRPAPLALDPAGARWACGAGGVAMGGGLVLALLMKGADGTLRYSLHRTTLGSCSCPCRTACARESSRSSTWSVSGAAGPSRPCSSSARSCCRGDVVPRWR